MVPYRFYPPSYPIARIPYPPFPAPPVAAPSRVDTFLQSTGQLMKTAQTYAPYVQQAMPMFKNLPALIRLYKGFQDTPAAEDRVNPVKSKRTAERPPERVPLKSKPSLPKIYQP